MSAIELNPLIYTTVEERLKWERETMPYYKMSRTREFQDPFTRKASKLNGHLFRVFDKGFGALEKQAKLFGSFGTLYSLRETFRTLDPAVTQAVIPDLETAVADFLELLERTHKRARADYRKDELVSLKSDVENSLKELLELQKTLTPAHQWIHGSFVARVVRRPRSKDIDNGEKAIFYEPLYLLRDAFFESPSELVIQEYIRIAEELDTEEFHREIYGESQLANPDYLEKTKLARDYELELDMFGMLVNR